MRLKNKYKGQPHRYKDNPTEREFSKWWQEINEKGRNREDLLSNLLDDEQKGYSPKPTKEEYRVAARVIQWLGSPVGFSLLSDFFADHPFDLDMLLSNVREKYPPR